jgi:hypothetical protein
MFVLIVMMLIGFFVLYLVVSAATGGQRKEALANQDEVLADMFDGEPETVSYTATLVNLPADIVIAEAHRRGYEIIADSQTTHGPRRLMFARRSES